MRRPLAYSIIIAVLLCVPSIDAAARRVPPQPTSETPGHRLQPPGVGTAVPQSRSIATVDTTILGDWTFDDGAGHPDPQGWTTLDFTAQTGTFFHVDDFAGMGVPWAPLAGSKSMWCGTRPGGDPELCNYATLPGYGNRWNQMFQSVAFPVTGAVTMDFLVRYDSEPSYDFTYVEYLSKSGHWNRSAQYTGVGQTTGSITVPADSLAGTVRFRFHFQSDDWGSDQDGSYNSNGAVTIDNLTVHIGGGVVDSQNFESEAVGALATADGHWTAGVGPAFGDYAALFDGSTVLQEDPLVTNHTHFWGFFNGSTATYACGGHPEQRAVPYGTFAYIDNGIVSPVLPVPAMDASARLFVEFDVYRDLALAPLLYGVFYAYRVRSKVGGCWGRWRDDGYVYYGAQKDWFRFRKNITPLLDPGASEMQISIIVHDYGDPVCHSQSPLVDNVRLVIQEGFTEFVVTNTDNSGPGSLRQAVADVNSNLSGTIHFAIPGTGQHTINLTGVSGLSILYPCVIDGTTQPGYAGTPLVRLACNSVGSAPVLKFANECTVRGLEIDALGLPHIGIDMQGYSSSVEACRIRNSSVAGIRASGSDTRIGGPNPGQGNELSGNGVGVQVYAPYAVSVRGNYIAYNTGLGIDLGGDGVTLNDPGDTDTGPNNLQNFPVITYYNESKIIGYLESSPSKDFTIDFYANASCGHLGYGEGQLYAGSTQVTTDANGHASFFYDITLPTGLFVTATATDAAGNTSEFSACGPSGSGYWVTTTAASGAGSLANAVTQANAHPGLDIILFNIPGPGPFYISSSSGYFSITDPVLIDGFSQPGAFPNTNPIDQPCNGALKIQMRSELVVYGGGSIIRGLCMNGGSGEVLLNAPGGNRVEGCYFGLDITGSTSGSGGQLTLNSDRNTIGGVTPASRNVIDYAVFGSGSPLVFGNDNIIQGNFIGLRADGNGLVSGVYLYGVNVTGARNLIGGSQIAARNVIAGQRNNIWIHGPGANENTVVGNYIGLDRTGTVDLSLVFWSNDGQAVLVEEGSGNLVGGASAYERNVIAGNVGVYLVNTNGNRVRGNYLNVKSDGSAFPYNYPRWTGVAVEGSSENWIGGTAPGEGNLVTGFTAAGAWIFSGTGNRVLGNSIYSNVGLGIDVGDYGVTPNDPGDVDTGANNLQNFPDLAAAVASPGKTKVSGTLSTSPNGSYRLEFFANDACHSSGHGEGKTFLGSAMVATDGSGVAPFSVSVNTAAPVGSFVTATATDGSGNTSEFSTCVEVINTPTGSGVTTSPVDSTTGKTPVTVTFDTVTGSGNTTLSTGPTGPPFPGSFLTGDSTYYDLSTTATFTGNVEVCISYDEAKLAVPEAALRLLHYDASVPAWVDVTSSLDTGANILCGTVTSLSPFVLGAGSATGVRPTPGIPDRFALHPNVPNPFNPTTAIRYDVPAGGAHVSITIYDVAGRRVRTLVNEHRAPGRYQAPWNGRNERGQQVASGVYFYRMVAGSFVQAPKMVLLK